MSRYTYFAVDGNYGDAKNLLTIDTSDFTEDDWYDIDSTNDNDRRDFALALRIRKDKESRTTNE